MLAFQMLFSLGSIVIPERVKIVSAPNRLLTESAPPSPGEAYALPRRALKYLSSY